MHCSDCEAEYEVYTCEQCHKVTCMACYRRYDYKLSSKLCWLCQNESDKKWLQQLLTKGR